MPDLQLLELPQNAALWQETLQWLPTEQQQQQFQSLYAGILTENQTQNLTRITQPDEFWEKHLWDSLWGILPWLNLPAWQQLNGKQLEDHWLAPAAGIPLKMIDIGTGAGFPGLPVAIALPHCGMTLLDSTRKKITFLETLIPQLQLNLATVKPVVGRAEQLHYQAQFFAHYDLALVRAVSNALTCARYALPFLKVGGYAVLYRGQWTSEEEATLKSGVEKLGGKIEMITSGLTPISKSLRHCIYLRKASSGVEKVYKD
ncbi:MAG: 16S rRNA (guanine(527)-N(7))-methyltransferase RsmG [Microcoleaceae cyanobacterium]